MAHASKNSFLDHVRLFRAAARAAGAEAILALDSMSMFLRVGNAHWAFQPKFLAQVDGQRQYTSSFTDDTTMFAGWLPYQLKRWQIANDKLAFKRYVGSVGLKTPACWLDADEVSNVLVKRPVSSFGSRIAGPFRSAKEHALDVAQGEYYEKFIPGRILKIWYWNESPVCSELDAMPSVVGDGVLTLAELIARRATMNRPTTDEDLQKLLGLSQPLLHYSGLELSTVLPKGKRQRIEFRYGSVVMHRRDRKVVDLTQPHNEEWTAELGSIGKKLASGIPAEIRRNTLFTVDAIVDNDNHVWLLEMNCNPSVHPLAYSPMVSTLAADPAGGTNSSRIPATSPANPPERREAIQT